MYDASGNGRPRSAAGWRALRNVFIAARGVNMLTRALCYGRTSGNNDCVCFAVRTAWSISMGLCVRTRARQQRQPAALESTPRRSDTRAPWPLAASTHARMRVRACIHSFMECALVVIRLHYTHTLDLKRADTHNKRLHWWKGTHDDDDVDDDDDANNVISADRRRPVAAPARWQAQLPSHRVVHIHAHRIHAHRRGHSWRIAARIA